MPFDDTISPLARYLAGQDAVVFAVLLGSRARQQARTDSDWDIALWISRDLGGMARIALLEEIRCDLGQLLGASPSRIDLIDLAHAGLAMRVAAANEGLLLKQDNGSVYNRFLNSTWRALDDFEWEQKRAA